MLKYWWDTFIEDKKLYFNKVRGHSMLAACARYGIQTISEDLKDYFVKNYFTQRTYTKEQMDKIIEYCRSDVDATAELFLNQLKILKKQNQ